jgi:hypothetical protein
VVSIVKKEVICAPGLEPVPADAAHQRWIIPLVNENQIGSLQRIIEIQSLNVIESRP